MLGLESKTTWSALLAGGCHAKHRPLEGNNKKKNSGTTHKQPTDLHFARINSHPS